MPKFMMRLNIIALSITLLLTSIASTEGAKLEHMDLRQGKRSFFIKIIEEKLLKDTDFSCLLISLNFYIFQRI